MQERLQSSYHYTQIQVENKIKNYSILYLGHLVECTLSVAFLQLLPFQLTEKKLTLQTNITKLDFSGKIVKKNNRYQLPFGHIKTNFFQ